MFPWDRTFASDGGGRAEDSSFAEAAEDTIREASLPALPRHIIDGRGADRWRAVRPDSRWLLSEAAGYCSVELVTTALPRSSLFLLL